MLDEKIVEELHSISKNLHEVATLQGVALFYEKSEVKPLVDEIKKLITAHSDAVDYKGDDSDHKILERVTQTSRSVDEFSKLHPFIYRLLKMV